MQKNISCDIIAKLKSIQVPVAQLDRASDCGSEGWKFKSSQAQIGEMSELVEGARLEVVCT